MLEACNMQGSEGVKALEIYNRRLLEISLGLSSAQSVVQNGDVPLALTTVYNNTLVDWS